VLVGRFEDLVRKYGNKLAFRQAGVELGYNNLYSLIDVISGRLASSIERTSMPLAILAAGGLHQVLGLMASLKAGQVCFVLDPVNPDDRIVEILRHAGSSQILCDAEHVERAGKFNASVFSFIESKPAKASAIVNRSRSSAGPTDPALIIFTSGSTGIPKGVVHTQQSLLGNYVRHAQAFSLTADDRQSLLYQLSVYGGVRDCLNALLSGASLHYFSVRTDGAAPLVKWLQDERISIYCSVASVFRELATATPAGEIYTALRLVKSGGEATHAADIERFLPHLTEQARIHCGLSASETGLACNYFIDRKSVLPEGTIPLGYAAEGIDVVLIDDAGRILESGAREQIGEICIESPDLALGYWNDEFTTRKSFLSTASTDGTRRYRTGDLGMKIGDGVLVHCGRKDQQVKIGGNRIDLIEVEAQLMRLQSVKQAAVAVLNRQDETPYLVAYIVATENALPVANALKDELRRSLPNHMVPASFLAVKELPRTPNGKIDRTRLRDCTPLNSGMNVGPDYAAPIDEIEKELCELFSKVLDIPVVGRDDNFFDLGGDSLTAMQLMTLIANRFKVELHRNDLWYKAPSVSALAVLLRSPDKQCDERWITIQHGGKKRPLLCLHTVGGGNLFHYDFLAKHFSDDRPLIGLLARGMGLNKKPDTTMAAIADYCVESIEMLQPEGPYVLCGHSSGGLVAFEVAQILAGKGKQVEQIYMFDSYLPIHMWRAADHLRRWQRIIKAGRMREVQENLYYFFLNGLRMKQLRRLRSLGESHRWAMWEYRAVPYNGDVTFFRAGRKGKDLEPPRDWRSLVTGTLKVVDVDANHGNLIKEPAVTMIAEIIKKQLSN